MARPGFQSSHPPSKPVANNSRTSPRTSTHNSIGIGKTPDTTRSSNVPTRRAVQLLFLRLVCRRSTTSGHRRRPAHCGQSPVLRPACPGRLARKRQHRVAALARARQERRSVPVCARRAPPGRADRVGRRNASRNPAAQIQLPQTGPSGTCPRSASHNHAGPRPPHLSSTLQKTLQLSLSNAFVLDVKWTDSERKNLQLLAL